MGKVLANRQEGPACFRLVIEAPDVVRDARPGQFVNVRTADSFMPLLRRPFSFCDIDKAGGRFSILYQVVGPGTSRLAEYSRGADLSIVGPLGNGFDVSQATSRSILCAGGIGIAPFPALARDLVAAVGAGKIHAVIGARTAALCLCQEDLRSLGIPVSLATEDGSAGTQGFVTGPLRELLDAGDANETTVYACGPQPMLAAVNGICLEYGCSGQLSVEAVMGCGVGACLSCVFRTPDGRYIRSCAEGPVFRSGEVIF